MVDDEWPCQHLLLALAAKIRWLWDFFGIRTSQDDQESKRLQSHPAISVAFFNSHGSGIEAVGQ